MSDSVLTIKWLLILLGLGFASSTQGQNYFPIPEQAGFWYKQRSTPNGSCVTDIFHLSGDTLIRGKRYQKLYVDRIGANAVFESADAEFLCFVRNDGARRVQITFANDFADRLHFDFNLQQGDSAMIYPFSTVPYKVRVASLDTVTILNEPRRKWVVEGDYPSEWIEGIGCMNGWFSPPSLTEPALSYIQCFYQSDTLTYQRNADPCYCLNTIVADEMKEAVWTQEGRQFTIKSPDMSIISIFDVSAQRVFESRERKFILPGSISSGIYFLSTGGNRLHKIHLP